MIVNISKNCTENNEIRWYHLRKFPVVLVGNDVDEGRWLVGRWYLDNAPVDVNLINCGLNGWLSCKCCIYWSNTGAVKPQSSHTNT